MRWILWITGALSAVLFIALVILAKGWLGAGGFSIFDDHLAGYSVASARDYLSALTVEQTALYLGLFRWIDTVFIILLTFTLASLIWTQARGMSRLVRGFIALTPCVYLMLYLSENAAVAHLLNIGPQVSAGAILQASAYTIAKWISLTLAMLLCVWAWRLSPKEAEVA